MQKKGSSSRGTPFFATLYDFFTAEPSFLLRGGHSFLILRDKPNPLLCCSPLRSPIRPARTFCAALPPGPRLIQSPAKWIMANCYVRPPPPNQSRLGLRTGFCALVGISGGVWGKNYLQGIFQILEKKPSSVLLRPKMPFPLP